MRSISESSRERGEGGEQGADSRTSHSCRFLKWEIPLRISSEVATYENQFGFCQRPTTRNTTWERAKFEVVGA